jgi:hypothetical protein
MSGTLKILSTLVERKVNRMSIKDGEENDRNSALERQGTVN